MASNTELIRYCHLIILLSYFFLQTACKFVKTLNYVTWSRYLVMIRYVVFLLILQLGIILFDICTVYHLECMKCYLQSWHICLIDMTHL